MSHSKIRELQLVSVDGRSLPADFRVGDQWVEVIGGTLRGSSTGEACSWTIEMDTGVPRSGTRSPWTIDENELEITFEGTLARNTRGESIPVPEGPHTYRFERAQEQPNDHDS